MADLGSDGDDHEDYGDDDGEEDGGENGDGEDGEGDCGEGNVLEGHLLVSLLLLIVQVYVFFQGFLRVNLRLRFSTKENKGTMNL